MQLLDKKSVFFDLDHTLWDFDKNAEETLAELFQAYNFENLGLNSVDGFIETYTRNNHRLWAEYHRGISAKRNCVLHASLIHLRNWAWHQNYFLLLLKRIISAFALKNQLISSYP